jgi:hypothetical protein
MTSGGHKKTSEPGIYAGFRSFTGGSGGMILTSGAPNPRKNNDSGGYGVTGGVKPRCVYILLLYIIDFCFFFFSF